VVEKRWLRKGDKKRWFKYSGCERVVKNGGLKTVVEKRWLRKGGKKRWFKNSG